MIKSEQVCGVERGEGYCADKVGLLARFGDEGYRDYASIGVGLAW
jgi:hypothetical protein